ncbi:MAG TPA: ABC transporter permease [Candidatus Saccharimonadales bacterium]|nr:ABC transporter permease [Candidatus Saccharimonadales bacterium]
MNKPLYTVAVFSKLNTRRFFRDRLALFFGILFPLIFLFVFGSISKGGGGTSFNVAVVNQSHSAFSKQYVKQLGSNKVFKVNKNTTTLPAAKDKMDKNQLDGTIVLPPSFGAQPTGQSSPTGQAEVVYTQNNQTAGQTLTSLLEASFKPINAKFVHAQTPFTVTGKQLNEKSLNSFDYTFAGLLGFSIVGLGIFGPVNVFPELKKQGILRRLHTTPLKVWQYFTSTMISQAIIGLVSLAVMFAVALTVFNLKVVGNYFEIVVFLIISIITILGIGLAIGGWAKNERQAAPLSNIVVFPMLFLSGTFFPRFLMPEWLQTVSAYLPLTPVIDGVRMIVTEGKHLTQIGPQLGLLAIWIVVIYAIAFRVFRWE